jgi:hypothetical protein
VISGLIRTEIEALIDPKAWAAAQRSETRGQKAARAGRR